MAQVGDRSANIDTSFGRLQLRFLFREEILNCLFLLAWKPCEFLKLEVVCIFGVLFQQRRHAHPHPVLHSSISNFFLRILGKLIRYHVALRMLEEAYDEFSAKFANFFCFFDFAIVDYEGVEIGLDFFGEFCHHVPVHVLQGEVFAQHLVAGDFHELHWQFIDDFLQPLLPSHVSVLGEEISDPAPVATDGGHQDGAEPAVFVQIVVDFVLQHAEVELVVSQHEGGDDGVESGLVATGRTVDPIAAEELAVRVRPVAGRIVAAAARVRNSGRTGVEIAAGAGLGDADGLELILDVFLRLRLQVQTGLRHIGSINETIVQSVNETVETYCQIFTIRV